MNPVDVREKSSKQLCYNLTKFAGGLSWQSFHLKSSDVLGHYCACGVPYFRAKSDWYEHWSLDRNRSSAQQPKNFFIEHFSCVIEHCHSYNMLLSMLYKRALQMLYKGHRPPTLSFYSCSLTNNAAIPCPVP